jgi:glycosyltransferase involved in cell wall biosynthesis
MARPLVSTVIPSYNYGRYVCEAVQSVLDQTYKPVEIIVVDDGSTDDTRSRLAAFGDAIRYIHQENNGHGSARNRGIRAATGEWIAFLDADDRWHPKKLEIQFDAARALEDVCFLGSPACGWSDELDAHPEVRRLSIRDFLTWTPLNSSSALVKRSCFDKIGVFDETLKGAEDRDMWMRLAAEFPTATVVSPCVSYRAHPGQTSRNPLPMYEGLEIVFRRFFELHPEYSGLRALADGFLHQDAGIAYLEAGNRWVAMGHMVRSVVNYPWPLNASNARYFRAKVLVRLMLGDSLLRRLRGRT